MDLSVLLRTHHGQLLLLCTGVFAILALLIIPSYLLAVRPKRGTTEWMRRIDGLKFTAPEAQAFRWSDIAWVALSAFCTAMLCISGTLLKYLRVDGLQQISGYLDVVAAYRVIPCTIVAFVLYLLLRSMFDQPLSAVCGATLGGLLVTSYFSATVLLTLSLLFLWYFITARARAHLLRQELMLLLSLVFYAMGLLRWWVLIWLAPVYAAAYIYVLVRRWRTAREHRASEMAISLLMLFFMAVGAIACAWVYYCYQYACWHNLLNLRLFGKVMQEAFTDRMHSLIVLRDPMIALSIDGLLLLIIGGASFVPVVHGAIARRDSLCLILLMMLPSFLAMWMLSGAYLCAPLLAMALTWVYRLFPEREYPSLPIIFTVVTVLAFLAEYYI